MATRVAIEQGSSQEFGHDMISSLCLGPWVRIHLNICDAMLLSKWITQEPGYEREEVIVGGVKSKLDMFCESYKSANGNAFCLREARSVFYHPAANKHTWLIISRVTKGSSVISIFWPHGLTCLLVCRGKKRKYTIIVLWILQNNGENILSC